MQPQYTKRTLLEKVREFKAHWKAYVFQSLFATISIFFVLVVMDFSKAVIVASIGATTFIIFALPNKLTARPYNVIGGHIVGILCGTLGAWMAVHIPLDHPGIRAAGDALAVGLAMFIMVVTDTEHPPAAGTALGVAIYGFSWGITGEVIAAAVLLSLIRFFFRKELRDLA